MISNLTPAQEPVAWGALATAILGVIVVFLPRFGITLSKDEYTALAGLAAVVIPLVVGYFVRQSVTPTAPPPAPVPVATPTPPI